MFHRRKEGEELRWGFNYDWDERVFIEIALVIPMPIFIFGNYSDHMRIIKYKCWQYYTVCFYFVWRRVKIRPTTVFDILTYLTPVKEISKLELHRIIEAIKKGRDK